MTTIGYLARAVMTTKTGLVADKVVNDYAFAFSGTPSGTDYANLQDAVDLIYNHTGGIDKVSEYMGPYIDRSVTHLFEVYAIPSSGPLGSPVFSNAWLGPATSVGGTTDLPAEVAAVLSFHADLTGLSEVGALVSTIPSDESAIDQGAPATHSGREKPKARRRGRVYIGTLATKAISVGGGSVPLLAANFAQAMRESAVAMAAAASGDGWTWSVWSRREATLFEVVGGWTDNAPDTQRRRGPKASARVTYSV